MKILGDFRHFEISENELSIFLQNYINNFNIANQYKHSRSQQRLTSEENVNLIFYDDLNDNLYKNGYDFSNLFKENSEQKLEEFINPEEISNPVALVEYKENFVKKFISKIKEKLSEIKNKFFNNSGNKSETILDTANNTDAKSVSRKIPSWDLSNWTQDELDAAKSSANELSFTVKNKTLSDKDDFRSL